jgi:hypothetical protein
MKDTYSFVTCVKKSLHSAVVINKTFKIQIVKSSGYNTDYIVVLTQSHDALFIQLFCCFCRMFSSDTKIFLGFI